MSSTFKPPPYCHMVKILGKNESIQGFQNRERSNNSNMYSYISLEDKNDMSSFR